MIAPKLFRSTHEPGMPVLSGSAGATIGILSAALIVNKAFSATSGGSFTDRTTEARLEGGTAFAPFQTPGTSDEFYIGMSAKFEQVRIALAALGVGGAYAWEYWNGSSWASISSVVDGTSGFTASGTVTWVIDSLTGWASSTINSATLFWIRARMTSAASNNPTIDHLTCTGWSEAFSTTNVRVYRMGEGSNGMFLRVDDTGTTEGRARGWVAKSNTDETEDDNNIGPFPTNAQVNGGLFIRKSNTADSGARPYVIICDDRTFYLFMASESGSPTVYASLLFGQGYSLGGPGDQYFTMIMGRAVTGVGTANENAFAGFQQFGTVANVGHYIARAYTGMAGSVGFGKFGLPSNSTTLGMGGLIPFPNAPDGGLALAPIHAVEGGPYIRGRLRGVWHVAHPPASFNNFDLVDGVGALAGRRFILLNQIRFGANITNQSAVGAFELSDTWETNPEPTP